MQEVKGKSRKSQGRTAPPAVAPVEVEQDGGAGILDRTIAGFNAATPHIALLAASVATAGSLYFSDVLGLIPCLLCWYQRILMYPLVIILAVGILRRDRNLPFYVLPVALFGGTISLYHYLLTKTNWLPAPPCLNNGPPCTVDYFNWFGFINIPLMALTAFAIISVMMGGYLLSDADTEPVGRTTRIASGVSAVAIPLLSAFIFFVVMA